MTNYYVKESIVKQIIDSHNNKILNKQTGRKNIMTN